ncbi:MAG: MATE family efflux transporter [Clostridiales bacterium]|nr:MATE family efflux transporter [Clostridiales bacterium]
MSELSSSEAKYIQMTETPMPKLVTSMALPAIASMLITTIYNMADTYFVSQIGTSASAAVGVVFAVMSLIQAVGGGFGMGAGSLISRKLGEKKDEEASLYASCGFFGALTFGLVLLVIGLTFLEPLMRILGATDTMLPYAKDYARYIFVAAPIMCSSFVLNNVMRSQGEAIMSMVGLCVGGVLNIGLDPLFIFTFGMGISGAAVATALSQLISYILMWIMFLSRRSIVRISPRRLSRRPKDYLTILKIGFPTICRQGLASVASALMNIQASVYGDAAVAAVTISNRIYLFVRNIILGIGQGFQPVAGYNFGAGKLNRVKESFRFTTIVGTVTCTLFSLLIWLNAGTIIAWFRADDAEVIRIGTTALYFAAGVMPFMAYSTYVNQMYQCLGFAKQATVLASSRQGLFYIPLVFILPAVFGLTGVQMAQPMSDLCTFFVSIPFQIWFYRKVIAKQQTT